MAFVSFAAPEPAWGVVTGAGVVDGRRLLGGACAGLKAVIAASRLDEAEREAAGKKPDFAREALTFLPVIPDPDHIFCAGLNYAAHAAETGQAAPGFPRMFLRAPSSMLGHGAAVERPKISQRHDFEGELAVIIGRGGRHIAEAGAMAHVAGYTCFMDGSIRDWQEHTTTSGKNFFASGPLGPVMVSAAEIRDPTTLTLVTRLNGEEVQRANDRLPDPHHSGADRLLLDDHAAAARRHHRHGHARGDRQSPQAAALHAGRRPNRGRDIAHRAAVQSGGGRSLGPVQRQSRTAR